MSKNVFLCIAFFLSVYAPTDLALGASCVKYFNQLYEQEPTLIAKNLTQCILSGWPGVDFYCGSDEQLRKVWKERLKALCKFNDFLQAAGKRSGYFRADFNKIIYDFVEKEPRSAGILLQDPEANFTGAAVQVAILTVQRCIRLLV